MTFDQKGRVWSSQDSVDGIVKFTSSGQDENQLSRGSGCRHRSPHGERSCPQHSMMNRPQPVSTDSKQILNDSVHMQEALRMIG